METGEAYRLLDVRPDASDEEVRRAWRHMTKVWHPDRFASDEELQQRAQEKLKEINRAYETIREERERGGWSHSFRNSGPQYDEPDAPLWKVRMEGREWPAPDLATILRWAAAGRVNENAEVYDPTFGSWTRIAEVPGGAEALGRSRTRRSRGWGAFCLAIAIFFLLRRPTPGGFIIAATFFGIAMFLFSRGR